MDIGPATLPGLFILIVLTIAFVTIYWVLDGSNDEEENEATLGKPELKTQDVEPRMGRGRR